MAFLASLPFLHSNSSWKTKLLKTFPDGKRQSKPKEIIIGAFKCIEKHYRVRNLKNVQDGLALCYLISELHPQLLEGNSLKKVHINPFSSTRAQNNILIHIGNLGQSGTKYQIMLRYPVESISRSSSGRFRRSIRFQTSRFSI
jgi:hypothetical protein